MHTLLYLTRRDVERALDAATLIDAVAAALVAQSAGRTSVPPRAVAHVPDRGWFGAMPGFVPGVGLGAKLVSVFPHNEARGQVSHQAIVVLADPDDGTPLAIMDGTAITALRTAAASAAAARALSRPGASVLAIIGAGVQGAAHLRILPLVRDVAEIRITSRNAGKAAALASQHPRAVAVASVEAAVHGADLVACCTDAREPVLRRAWLAAGVHVGSVGGTFGRELDDDTLRDGRVFVEWRGAVQYPPPVGATDLQGMAPERVTEIGEVLAGTRPGRLADQDITVYRSTGHAAEDLAAARLVYDRARAEGLGTALPR